MEIQNTITQMTTLTLRAQTIFMPGLIVIGKKKKSTPIYRLKHRDTKLTNQNDEINTIKFEITKQRMWLKHFLINCFIIFLVYFLLSK